MRPLTTETAAISSKAGYAVHARVLIADADDVLRDYGQQADLNWVHDVEIEESNDNPTATARVRLFRAHDYLSLAPLHDSKLNRDAAGAYARAIDLGRRIEIYAAFSGSDAGVSSWEPIFSGHVFEVDWGKADSNFLTVAARDLGGKIIDRFIEDDKLVYSTSGGTAVETVMQDLLDVNMTAPDFTPVMFTDGAPGWNIRAYQQDRMGTGEATRRLAMQIGWDVRYRWRVAALDWTYTFYEPPRTPAGTPDRVWTRSAYFDVSQQALSLESVRNRVKITFTEKTGLFQRISVVFEDAASIAKYGVRFMEVAEAATSGIDTTTEADRMAQAILADLSEPLSYVTLVTPAFYLGQLGDTLEIEKDGVTFDQAIKIVVSKHTLRIGGGKHSSTWVGRQSGGGYRDRWLESEVRPGVAPRQDLASDSNVLRVLLGADQNIGAASVDTIVFDTVGYDYGSNYNLGTGEWTCPVGGQWEFKAGAKFLSANAGTTSQISLYRNGLRVGDGDRVTQPGAATDTLLHLKAVVLQLDPADVMTVRFEHDDAGAQPVVGDKDTTWLVRRLRGGG